MAHTPSSADSDMAPPTTYTLATRQPPASFGFQKLPEICAPFGLNRSPSFQFIQRLREFPPNMQDILVVASTSSEEVGLFTRSKAPLVSDVPAEKITHVFTTTTMANDSRRAQIPMTEDMSSNTSAIGMAMDLSSKTKVARPLPGEEMDESPSPLPALMILNNEGVLMAWWVVYADSIRQGTAYPGLVAIPSNQQASVKSPTHPAQPAQSTGFSQPAQPAFGQSTFGQSTLGQTTFGQSEFAGTPKPAAPAFGQTSMPAPANGAFGGASHLGSQQSPWGATTNTAAFGAAPSFGKPSFGTPSQPTAFGASGGLGNRPSPWGTASTASPTAPTSVFGQSGGLGMRTGSNLRSTTTGPVYSAPSTSGPATSGGFASFAKAPGLAATSAVQGNGESVFGKPNESTSTFGKATTTPSASFTSAMDVGSSFGGTPSKAEQKSTGLLGSGDGFVLGSAWKKDDTAKAEPSGPPDTSSTSLFGGDFDKTLGEVASGPSASQINEADMLSDPSEEEMALPSSPDSPPAPETTTPADTPAPSRFLGGPPTTGGLFGTLSQGKDTPAAVQNSTPTPATFGKPSPPMMTPKQPEIKEEPVETPFGVNKDLPQAPLPPNTVSKTSYTPGDSSASSTATSKSSNDDAPLPPDFVSTKSKLKDAESSSDAPLPPDSPSAKSKPKAADSSSDTPLPPDFLPSKPKPKESEAVAQEQPPLPEEDDEEEDEGEEEEEDNDDEDNSEEEEGEVIEEKRGLDSEGSGVDVAQEMSPSSEAEPSPKVSPESSFGVQDKSPLGGLFTKVVKPTQPGAKSLFGEMTKKPPVTFFATPTNAELSPRSPSPVRSSLPGHLFRPETSRSVSAPGAPRGGINRKVTIGRPTQPRISQQATTPPEKPRIDERERLAVLRARQEAEEEQELSDREDEKVREELASEITPSLTLDPFLAHQDYIGNIDKPGIPGQIEKVYRDINSMIDTLGLNARSLTAFTTAHSEMNKEAGRTREDLESDADWVLIEIADLAGVENELEADLQSGRLQDIQGKLHGLRDLQKDLAKLRAKSSDIKRVVEAKSDPQQIEALRSAPLSVEQSALRRDLRRDFTKFQKLLSEAEEGISMLRAKLAAVESASHRGSTGKVPTVEAVERTILKMTGMVEKKSGDIDFLETQMRRLNVLGIDGGGGGRGSDADGSSREGSPFVTPPTSVRKATAHSASVGRGAGPAQTPQGKLGFGSSIMRKAGGGSARKKLSEITSEEVEAYAGRVRRRKGANQMLKEAVVKGGVRVRGVDVL